MKNIVKLFQMRLKDNRTGKEAIYQTEVNFKVVNGVIYLDFYARHSSLFSFSDKYNDTIYCGDACEIFIDLGEDYYLEIEAAPNNTLFIAKVDKKTRDLTYLENTFVNSHTEKYLDGYLAKLTIDLKEFNILELSSLRYNIFRIETDGGTPDKHLFALNPTLCGTFHVQEKFLEEKLK